MKSVMLASLEDAAAILTLQKLAYQSEARLYNDFQIPPLTQTLAGLESDLSSKTCFKAEIDGQIIGSVRGYEANGTGHIERLIVHPDFQGRGIGTELINQIESRFAARRFELFTGHKSAGNIRLYERLGYKIFKSQEMNATLSLVWMEKLI